MMIRIAAAILLLTATLSFRAGASDEDDYRYVGMIVSSLKNVVQFSMTRGDMQKGLASIPNSEPYYKNGVYEGQVFKRGGKEIGLMWANFKQGKAVLAGFGAPPMRQAEAKDIYDLFDQGMARNFRRTQKGKFDIGNGLRAELNIERDKSGTVVSVYVLR